MCEACCKGCCWVLLFMSLLPEPVHAVFPVQAEVVTMQRGRVYAALELKKVQGHHGKTLQVLVIKTR